MSWFSFLQSFPDASYTIGFPGTIRGAVWSFWQSRKQSPYKKAPLAESAIPRLWFQVPDKASQVPSIQSGSDYCSRFFLRFLIFTYLFHSCDIFISGTSSLANGILQCCQCFLPGKICVQIKLFSIQVFDCTILYCGKSLPFLVCLKILPERISLFLCHS